MANQYRNFVFTLNNYTELELLALTNLFPGTFSYIILGKEVGESGTPHIQGYAELKFRKTFKSLKALIPRAHIEPRRGSQQEAIDYCKKEGVYEHFGSPRRQGNRTDLSTIRSVIDGGGCVRDIFKINEIQLNESSICFAEKYLAYRESPRNHKPIVCWFYGAPGSGKTRLARFLLPDAYFKNTATGKWWNGYDGHSDVIIDDIRADYIDFVELLGLLDRYEHRIQIKGGIRQFKATRIIITSPEKPARMYCNSTEDMQQLQRRLDCCVEITPDDLPEIESDVQFLLQDDKFDENVP